MNNILSSQCIDDMREISRTGIWSLDAQLRSYAYLEMIQDNGCLPDEKAAFLVEYGQCAERLVQLFDAEFLKSAAAERVKPLEEELNELRFKAAAAESLHEYAKEAFETWQNAGVFMRKRVLKELRQRAGFQLESHRIGNYVAKTYDLMEEARLAFQKKQQALYAANVQYKCNTNLYKTIADFLSAEQ